MSLDAFLRASGGAKPSSPGLTIAEGVALSSSPAGVKFSLPQWDGGKHVFGPAPWPWSVDPGTRVLVGFVGTGVERPWILSVGDPIPDVVDITDRVTAAEGAIDDVTDRVTAAEEAIDDAEEAIEVAARGTGRINLLDNGAMRIAQRGGVVSGITTTNSHPSLDRWRVVIENGCGTWEMASTDVLLPTGLARAMRMRVTTAKTPLTAADRVLVTQRLEGLVASQMMQTTTETKPVVLSYWAYVTVGGIYISEFDQQIAGVLQRRYTSAVTIPANTWTKIVVPVPTDLSSLGISTNTDSAYAINFWLAAGSNFSGSPLQSGWTSNAVPNVNRATGQVNVTAAINNAWHITEAQLEVGTTPTVFERLRYEDDLRRCMRYFQRHAQPPLRGFISNATAATRLGMELPVRMRATPLAVTMNGSLPVYDGITTSTLSAIGSPNGTNPGVIEIDATTSGYSGTFPRALIVYQSGSASLDLSADL